MKNYDDFLEALGQTESGSRYNIENSKGYIGKYQWGEAMLQDLGYYEQDASGYRKNDWIGNWTGKNGIWGKKDLLNNPEVQEIIIKEEMKYLNRLMEHYGYNKYIGKIINDIEITRTGILAGAHLKGYGKNGISTFLKNNIDGQDAYGTKISKYISKFAGYETPFHKEIDNINNINGINNEPKFFIWHTEEGENTCDYCNSRNGKIFEYGIDEEPPLHPNCRCKIEPIKNYTEYKYKIFENKIKNIIDEMKFIANKGI